MVWFVFYFLWPILFLPVAAQVARFNLRGFFGRHLLNAFRPLRELRFWAVYIACFVVGMYIPYRLANISPKESASLHYQTGSMVLRLGIGYLLLVTAWLVICVAITRVVHDTPDVQAEVVDTDPVAPVVSKA
jgi:hypothetical protein